MVMAVEIVKVVKEIDMVTVVKVVTVVSRPTRGSRACVASKVRPRPGKGGIQAPAAKASAPACRT